MYTKFVFALFNLPSTSQSRNRVDSLLHTLEHMARPVVVPSPSGLKGDLRESSGPQAKNGAAKPKAGKTSPSSSGDLTLQRQPQEMGPSSQGELPNTQAADVFCYGRALGLHAGDIDGRDLDTSESVFLADWCCLLTLRVAAVCYTAATNCVTLVPDKQMNTLAVFGITRGYNRRERIQRAQLKAVVPPVRDMTTRRTGLVDKLFI